MCWSATASLALGTAGVATSLYAHKKGQSPMLTLPLGYFSLMELLQFVSYFYIDQCGFETNTLLTQLGYLHIVFQPIFINMFFMWPVKDAISLRMKALVYGLSGLAGIILFIKLIPTSVGDMCTLGQTLCGPAWCTLTGNWHLAWSVPYYNGIFPGDGFIYYGLAVFVLPLLYARFRIVALFLVSGPVLAYILTSGNMQEWPAVWCLFSVLFILIGLYRSHKELFGKTSSEVK